MIVVDSTVGTPLDKLSSLAGQSGALVSRAAGAVTSSPGKAVSAARSLTKIDNQPSPTPIDGIEGANRLFRQLGISHFTPTVGLSKDLTLPLAIGGVVAGPYTPGIGNLTIGNISVNAVRRGEVLLGFVPVGIFTDFGNKAGVNVAWLNLSTLDGGVASPLGGLTDTILDAVLKRVRSAPLPHYMYEGIADRVRGALNIVPSNGVRGGLVDTGPGLVLCAVYGTVKRGETTYYFLPSVGFARAS